MPSQQPTYLTEFPDFVLDVTIPDGFRDVSWKNDACPTWLNDAVNVFLHVDYAREEDREHQEIPRFQLTRSEDGMVTEDEPLLLTDDWSEVTARVEQMTVETAMRPA